MPKQCLSLRRAVIGSTSYLKTSKGKGIDQQFWAGQVLFYA